ncbi:hypothetical protein, partial [Sphingobacterium ginsenosidimutans]|uniref:hypothetical protein n=1 Tax=Sphingobacterium ginsenosidimutans TaxID=687845 RepID=UPI0031F72DFE
QSRWYCRNRWESRSVPFFTRKPLLETVKGFFRLVTSQKIQKNNGCALKLYTLLSMYMHWACCIGSHGNNTKRYRLSVDSCPL